MAVLVVAGTVADARRAVGLVCLLLAQLLAASACDWNQLGRMVEAVTDSCCFGASGSESSQPPLGNTAAIREGIHREWLNTLPWLTREGSAGPGFAADAIYCQEFGGEACAEFYTLAAVHGPAAQRNAGISPNNQCRVGLYGSPWLSATLDNCELLDDDCAHLYPSCTRCVDACEESVVQESLAECDRHFARKAQLTELLQTRCSAPLAGCDTECVGNLVRAILGEIDSPEVFWAWKGSTQDGGQSAQNCLDAYGDELDAVAGRHGTEEPELEPELGRELEPELEPWYQWAAAPAPAPSPWTEPPPSFDMGSLLEGGCELSDETCAGISCDGTCEAHLRPLLDTCGDVVDALFDSGDGTFDGLAAQFSALRETCPRAQQGEPGLGPRDKLPHDQCREYALSGTIDGVAPDAPLQVCDEGGFHCVDVEANMLSVAAKAATDGSQVAGQPWLRTCTPNGVYDACHQVYDEIMNTKVYQDGYAGNDDYLAAPNLNWRDAVTPRGETDESSTDDPARWTDALMVRGGDRVLKCRDTTKTQCGPGRWNYNSRDSESVWPASDDDCTTGYVPGTVASPSTTCPGAGTDTAAVGNSMPCILTPATGDPAYAVPDTPETCLPSTGPIEATNDNSNGWADIIANYTTQRGSAFAQKLQRCERALIAHTRVTDSSACRGTDDDVPAGDANSYRADCDACNEVSWTRQGRATRPAFSFTSGAGSDACLNFFVGYMEHMLNPSGDTQRTRMSCLDQIRSPNSPSTTRDDSCILANDGWCEEFIDDAWNGDYGYDDYNYFEPCQPGTDATDCAANIGQGERQQHVEYLVGRAFAYDAQPFAGTADPWSVTAFCDYTPQSTVADYTRYGNSLTRAVALSVEGVLSLRPPPPPPPRPPPPPVPASCASFPEFMVRPLSSSFENVSRELKNAPVDLPQVFSNVVTEACCDAPGVTCPCAHTLTVPGITTISLNAANVAQTRRDSVVVLRRLRRGAPADAGRRSPGCGRGNLGELC